MTVHGKVCLRTYLELTKLLEESLGKSVNLGLGITRHVGEHVDRTRVSRRDLLAVRSGYDRDQTLVRASQEEKFHRKTMKGIDEARKLT